MFSFNPQFRSPEVVLEKHISVKAAAECSGYSIQYLRRLLRDGLLEGTKIGQVWLIEMASFDRYLRNGQMLARSAPRPEEAKGDWQRGGVAMKPSAHWSSKMLWIIYLALLAVLLPHTAWAFARFESPSAGWLGVSWGIVTAWAAAFAFEAAIAALTHKLARRIGTTPRYTAGRVTAPPRVCTNT